MFYLQKAITFTNGAIIVCMPLMFRIVTGGVAFRSRYGDYPGFTAKQSPVFIPLSMRSVLCAVVPTSLASCAATLARHHNRTVFHQPTLLCTFSTLDETILQQKRINKHYKWKT